MGQKVFMTKGDGKHGYNQNSTPIRGITDALVFPMLDEALQQLSLPISGERIVVADLGCASTPNSIVNVSHIVDALRSRWCLESNLTSETPALRNVETPREFQVYFNDLPWNDFNTLFKFLCGNDEADRPKFYFAGVPGTFFDRLFPRSSVHIFVSQFAVHFLSKIPHSLSDENSLAFNKGSLWLDGSTDATAQAYKEQSSLDLKSFLNARYEELVPGGLLCFIIKTRLAQRANALRSTDDSVDAVQICVRETAEAVFSKGILTQQQLDALHVPLYYPLFQEELLEIIKSFDSAFEILKAEQIGFPMFFPHGSSSGNECSDANSVVRTSTGWIRGIIGGIFEQVMGNEEQEVYWQHFAQIAEKYSSDLKRDCHFACISMLKR